MQIKSILPILTSIIFFSCSPASQDLLHKELENLFDGNFSNGEPGGSILISKKEKIVLLKNYGMADLNTGEKITSNTLFNTGSISKTFVSNGILILKERGLLSLDDQINDYFPDFESPPIVKDIRIVHLLTHSSGLPDLRPIQENREFYLTAKDKENFNPEKAVRKLNFQPGTNFEYSNPAFNGLALIIENVTGLKWQDFIKQEIFEPSGMVMSTITDGPHPDKGVAHAYEKIDGKFTERDYGEVPTFAAAGNGGVWSNVQELALYEKAMQNQLFLNKSILDESRSIYSPSIWDGDLKPFLGYSWFIGEETFLGKKNPFNVKIIYHTGSQGGFRSFYISIPEKELLYIVLLNKPVENLHLLMLGGLKILMKHNWLDSN